MAGGFNLGEFGHVIPVIYPIDCTGGENGETFCMRDYSHVDIVVVIGATAGALTNLVISECTGKDAAGAVAIAYTYYACETTGAAANADVLGDATAVSATGIALSETDNIMYVASIDAAQLSAGYEWIYVQITGAAAVNLGCVIAILSGSRYSGPSTRTALDN